MNKVEEPILISPEEVRFQKMIREELEEEVEDKLSVIYYNFMYNIDKIDSNKILILPVYLEEESRTGWYIIINKRKLNESEALEVQVPKDLGLEEIFRGEDLWQEMYWKNQLHKELKVVGV